jgi:hypothetical protein
MRPEASIVVPCVRQICAVSRLCDLIVRHKQSLVRRCGATLGRGTVLCFRARHGLQFHSSGPFCPWQAAKKRCGLAAKRSHTARPLTREGGEVHYTKNARQRRDKGGPCHMGPSRLPTRNAWDCVQVNNEPVPSFCWFSPRDLPSPPAINTHAHILQSCKARK